tara:strand:+ start:18964 stop:19368 length:405 start_codon:yes stop_codon:yes gene_type:complete
MTDTNPSRQPTDLLEENFLRTRDAKRSAEAEHAEAAAALMSRYNRDGVRVAHHGDQKLTRVTPERNFWNQEELVEVLTTMELTMVSKLVIDIEILEQAVLNGKISAEKVAPCMETTQTRPYIRVSQAKEGNDHG